jgi:hypothetical protein
MICPERERLQRVYSEAAARIADAGAGILDMTSAKWKQATSGARLASKAALKALNIHRKEHGC